MKRAGLLLALTLGACVAAGPRASAPQAAAVVPPPGWRTALPVGGPVTAQWWNLFGDPQLTAIVERALANNLDIATAATRVEEARAAYALARAQLLPQINANVGAQEGQTLSPFGTPSRGFTAQPEVDVSYVADLFGRLRFASGAARAQLLASEGARDTVRLATAASAASSYITLRALDQRLAIAKATLTARAEALHVAERRFKTGYSSRLEYRQAQAEYASTAQLVPAAELAISKQENALSILLGDAPGAIPRGRTLEQLATPPIPASLPSELLRRRPDLHQAEQTLVAADLSLDSQRAAFLPSISLTGTGGVVLSNLIPNPVGLFSIGASILAPIFDGGRLRAQADAATARRDQAAFAYRKTALGAFREVDDALVGVQKTGEQAEDFAQQAVAAQGALDNATARYRAGYSSFLEQLDSQRSLLSAQLSVTQARADRLTSYVSAYQAMGGGWSPADIQTVRRANRR